jgi:hypothetical protein
MTILEFRNEESARLKHLMKKAAEAFCELKEAFDESGEEYDDGTEMFQERNPSSRQYRMMRRKNPSESGRYIY